MTAAISYKNIDFPPESPSTHRHIASLYFPEWSAQNIHRIAPVFSKYNYSVDKYITIINKQNDVVKYLKIQSSNH
jgi:hypothetical protein